MILHVGFPAVGHKPTADEVVIITVKLILSKPPLLIGKTTGEFFVLQDVGAIGNGTARETWHATVDLGHGSTIKVSSFEIQSAKEVVDALGEVRSVGPAKALTSNHTTIFLLLKRCQHPLQSFDGPSHIVICKDNDFGGDFGDGTCHLTALIGVLDRHAFEAIVIGCRHFADDDFRFGQVLLDGHQDEFFRFVFEDRCDSLLQFFTFTIEGRQNDSNILSGQGCILGYGNWSESPECPEVDDQA